MIRIIKIQFLGGARHSSDWLCWQRRCCLLGFFFYQGAGKRTEAIFFHPPEMARAGKGLPPPTKTESIQLPDGEIDTETLSPVSL